MMDHGIIPNWYGVEMNCVSKSTQGLRGFPRASKQQHPYQKLSPGGEDCLSRIVKAHCLNI